MPPIPWPERLSANLGLLWADLPIPEAIARAGRSGFGAVELHYPGDSLPKDVAEACRAAGVRLLGVNMPAPNGALRSCQKDFRADFERLRDWSVEAGAQAIHLLAGTPTAEDQPGAPGILARNAAWAADRAGEGIVILLEPINWLDRPGWALRRPSQAADVIRKVARPNVGMQFDAYHTAREGLDPTAEFLQHMDVIRHVQIAGAPGRDEPDRGDVDYAAFLSAVEASAYDGWIGCEYRPRGAVEEGLGWRETLQQRGRATR